MSDLTLTWPELRERRGLFSISSSLIVTNLDIVHKVMAQVFIVRCEHIFLENRFCYDAYCELFAPIPPDVPVPSYEFQVDEAGVVTWRQVESDYVRRVGGK